MVKHELVYYRNVSLSYGLLLLCENVHLFYMLTKNIYITEKKIWPLGRGGSGAVLCH